jgi:hypothetical protein
MANREDIKCKSNNTSSVKSNNVTKTCYTKENNYADEKEEEAGTRNTFGGPSQAHQLEAELQGESS